MHAEMQILGRKPDPTKPEITDMVEKEETKKAIKEHNIETAGLALSYTEGRALFAVQKLLDQTDYKGNTKPRFELPGLQVNSSEFLDAYGVKKYATKRGKTEWSGSERDTAINALERLATKQFLFVYDRVNWHKRRNENEKETKEFVSPVIALQKGANGSYLIYPYPILVDQIGSYFLLKPADLYELAVGRDETCVRYFVFLLCQIEQKRRNKDKKPVKIVPETLARILRMDTLVETRQENRIRRRLNKFYELGKENGYLTDFAIEQPGLKADKVDVLWLRTPQ